MFFENYLKTIWTAMIWFQTLKISFWGVVISWMVRKWRMFFKLSEKNLFFLIRKLLLLFKFNKLFNDSWFVHFVIYYVNEEFRVLKFFLILINILKYSSIMRFASDEHCVRGYYMSFLVHYSVIVQTFIHCAVGRNNYFS